MAEIEGGDSRGASQTVKALLSMRELLLTGEIAAGQRVSEIWAVDRLGVSRTPVRAALARLEEEGFLEGLPGGGYAVKTFTEQDAFDAIENRGALEGLSARLAAERGVDPACLQKMDLILDQIDILVTKRTMSSEDFGDYTRLNERLHLALAEASGGGLLARQIERAQALPFAHPSAFVKAQSQHRDARTIFILAQDQHLRVPFQHDVEGRVQGLDHVHGGHDQTPSCWRWRRRRQSGWANTSSNRVREDTRDWPSVPTASASRAAARTASCASCSAD